MAPLVYLKKQLNFPLSEWKDLPPAYQDWYKNAAIEEMKVLGIEIK